ncbi:MULTISPECIES: ADP-ribose diphosphatase [Pasteurellaceae]|uniref:ADP-ribose pyrophosphatase n=1 Tax=Pasteurella atlantica TaxID=2827233 RepID=A0AAW8CNL9_9PAST|nr:ADP-ribose diphosphatase [Pasteurella atlantica]MBR0573011.1 ADP-ribose diphosphatase [Pasteurella atlantica]MDP8038862.1 ADP-ribose diphosphatase [Pasteurella atlantica]MDP8041029.1 ADP-ribose diphosphatase [Pasteurella atlantica]MDP8043165.1 ADP-ribose diphosphatase [Pasteurella atlantica]MDP8045251.1 ADP-ribose diphosphatase [Pasteurella atlantica]
MSKVLQFNQKDIEILREETVYKGHFELKKVFFRHKLYAGGMSGEVCRELLMKGAASALIAYDPVKDNVVLIEQVRIGAYEPESKKSPWLLELIAGMIDTDESPEEVAIRESKEEAGLTVENIQHALTVWDSPGGMAEKLHIYLGLVDTTNVGGIYGLEEENEDILVHIVSREIAYQWIEEGKIDNVIAVLGLQWLQLNYHKFRK